MSDYINVTLLQKGQSVDIRVPTKIEVKRLIKELDSIYNYPFTRTKYQIHVINKGLILDEGQVLQHYPVTTGDILEIEEILK